MNSAQYAELNLILNNSRFNAGIKRSSALTASFTSIAAKTVVVLYGLKKAFNMGLNFVKMGSDVTEFGNRFKVTFAGLVPQAESAMRGLANAYGLSNSSAREMLGAMGDLMAGFGATKRESLDFAQAIVDLGINLASFQNRDIGDVLEKLEKGVMGQTRNLKLLGITIDRTSKGFKNMVRSIMSATGAGKQMAQAMAILKISQQQSVNAMGDFARTRGSFANQMREAKESAKQLGGAIGLLIIKTFKLPKVMALVNKALRAALSVVQLLNTEAGRTVVLAGTMLTTLAGVTVMWKSFASAVSLAAGSLVLLKKTMAGVSMSKMGGSLNTFRAAKAEADVAKYAISAGMANAVATGDMNILKRGLGDAKNAANQMKKIVGMGLFPTITTAVLSGLFKMKKGIKSLFSGMKGSKGLFSVLSRKVFTGVNKNELSRLEQEFEHLTAHLKTFSHWENYRDAQKNLGRSVTIPPPVYIPLKFKNDAFRKTADKVKSGLSKVFSSLGGFFAGIMTRFINPLASLIWRGIVWAGRTAVTALEGLLATGIGAAIAGVGTFLATINIYQYLFPGIRNSVSMWISDNIIMPMKHIIPSLSEVFTASFWTQTVWGSIKSSFVAVLTGIKNIAKDFVIDPIVILFDWRTSKNSTFQKELDAEYNDTAKKLAKQLSDMNKLYNEEGKAAEAALNSQREKFKEADAADALFSSSKLVRLNKINEAALKHVAVLKKQAEAEKESSRAAAERLKNKGPLDGMGKSFVNRDAVASAATLNKLKIAEEEARRTTKAYNETEKAVNDALDAIFAADNRKLFNAMSNEDKLDDLKGQQKDAWNAYTAADNGSQASTDAYLKLLGIKSDIVALEKEQKGYAQEIADINKKYAFDQLSAAEKLVELTKQKVKIETDLAKAETLSKKLSLTKDLDNVRRQIDSLSGKVSEETSARVGERAKNVESEAFQKGTELAIKYESTTLTPGDTDQLAVATNTANNTQNIANSNIEILRTIQENAGGTTITVVDALAS